MHGPDQVLELLRDREVRGRRVFEGSCGRGRLTRELRALGCEVVGSTFDADSPLPADVRCLTGVDLNERLPLEDESFDVAVLQEVIEHLESPAHAIREVNRILVPGGRWILTTPNALCLRSRLHFLLCGFVKGRRRPADYNRPPGDYNNLFIPFFPTLHYLLWIYGFRVRRTGRSRRRWSSLLLAVLLPAIWGWTWSYTRSYARYDSPRQREAVRDLRRLLLSPHLLFDENVVLELEKVHGLEGLYAPRVRAASGGASPVPALAGARDEALGDSASAGP